MSETKPKLFEAIASKLQLDEMYGQTVASLFLLPQLLVTLVEAGVLTREQVEATIAGASAGIDATLDSYNDPNRSDPSTVRKYAKSALSDFRKILNDRTGGPVT